jgi:ubiquinone/menaquinone biosynthesis C-methylase UbiE
MEIARRTAEDVSVNSATRVPNLEFTGERIVPGKTSEPLFREHEQRYAFAGRYVSGKEVLDVACGTGIGTNYLRKAGAVCCYGVDIDPGAIEYANARYRGCFFVQGDASQLDLPDRSVDVVVSFETIEHISDQERFILECNRVLKPGGLLICSTPNRRIYRWYGENPYHIRELSLREFSTVFAAHFGDLQLFSQGERIYPIYVLRLLASRLLENLKLKRTIKGIVGSKAPPAMRQEFSAQDENLNREIRPYRKMWGMEPMYLIAVTRKTSG